MTWTQRLILFVAVPAVIATQNGVRGSALAPDLPLIRNVLFYLPMTLLSWNMANWFSVGIYKLTRAERVTPSWAPRLVILPLGGWLAGAACYYVIGFYLAGTGDFFGQLHQLVGPDGYSQRRPFTTAMLGPSAMIALLIWTVVNLAFDKLFGVPRLRPADPPAAEPETATPDKAPAPPGFLVRLAPNPTRDLLAVEAQEHYIKVYTLNGNELLLYRFKDAVRDLAPYGLQVHRSHWVAKSAIAGVDNSSRAMRLTLRNGLQVPVSTAYRGALKMAGVL